jgi:hypothetical protein
MIQVGPTVERFTEKGNRFIATFYVSRAELSTYLVPWNTDVSALLGVPRPCTAYDTSNREAGTGPDGTLYYLVSIWANGNYNEGYPKLPDPNFWQMEYDIKPEYLPANYFGARLAEFKEIYNNNDPAGLQTTPNIPKNIDGQDASLGDYIFNNWKSVDAPSGGPIYTRLPYTSAELEDTEVPYICIQEFPKTTCTITWMEATGQVNKYASFLGISGGFAARPELVPIDAVDGVWKASAQKVTTYKQQNGLWCKIVRTLEKCPLYDTFGCTWDVHKNGGVWEW